MLEASTCPVCGTELAPGLLTCPGCRRLVHADRLRELADQAGHVEGPTEALVAWRDALELLPTGTRQHEVVAARIAELGRRVDASPTGPGPRSAKGGPSWAGAAGIGTLALAGWKFKTIAVMVLAKGKLLLVGLTKLSTLTSMFLAMGVYWTVFGWKFAAGLVLSIYIHEMGHVAALLRYGVKASAPLFIPGLGAVIRYRQALGDPRQDARVGLAGPVWGLGAALACWGIWQAGGGPYWAGLAKFGAFINLFNLLPLYPLDGGRGFQSLTRSQRWLGLLAVAVAWSLATDPTVVGLLTLLLLVGALTSAIAPGAAAGDREALAVYAGLALALAQLAGLDDTIRMPGG